MRLTRPLVVNGSPAESVQLIINIAVAAVAAARILAPPLSNDIICSCINKAYCDLDARGFASEIRAFSLYAGNALRCAI